MTVSFLPKNSFPLPAPLTTTLVTLGLDHKTATSVSKVYLSSALNLGETFEREYNDACRALLIASDNRGYSSKELRAKLLTVLITQYSQALSKLMEEVTQKTKASLLKERTKCSAQHKVSALPYLSRFLFKLPHKAKSMGTPPLGPGRSKMGSGTRSEKKGVNLVSIILRY